MADGTVRGVFDLDVRPAVRGVREYRREAAAADAQTKRLGQTIDRSFSRAQVKQINEVGRATTNLARDTTRVRMEVRREWQGMRRDVQREAAQIVSTIAVVRDRMRALSRERATPTIDVDGIARALAQVELLQTRLAGLGAMRVSPRVAMTGGAGGVARGGAAAARGLGGTGGSGIRSLDMGPMSLSPKAWPVIAGVGLPAIQALGGGATSLVGSAGAGLLGAGTVGMGAVGPLLGGIAGVVSVAKPAGAALKEVVKAQEKLTQAVREHGRASQEAQEAERELGRLRRLAGPGSGRVVRESLGFQRDWRRLTRPARGEWYGMLGDMLATGRRAAPLMAENSLVATRATRSAGDRFTRHLAGVETQGNLAFFTQQFARELPIMERSLENVSFTVQRLSRAASPFFHDANVWIERWTWGWRTSSKDIEGTRDRMQTLIDSAKDWRDLTGATWDLLRDIFSASRPSGDSMVRDLTRTFDRWDAWIKTHPEETRGWFEDTAESVSELASALSKVVGWLNETADVLRPVLDRFSQLVGLTASLGLIGTPGAAAMVFGGMRGARGAFRGGAPGAAPVAGGSGGAFLAGGAAAGAMAGATGAVRTTGVVQQLVHPGAAPRTGALAYGEGFRYGGPVSQLGGRTTMFGRGMTAAGAGLSGAARAYWPIALALGGLDFAAFDGGVGDRTVAALSSMSLGIVPRPLTGEQHTDRGLQAANDVFAGIDAIKDPRRQVAELRRPLAEMDAYRQREGKLPDFMKGMQIGGVDVDLGDRREVAAMREALRDELKTRRELVRQIDREKKQRANERARQRGVQYGAGLGSAFNVYRRAGMGDEEAMSHTVGQVRGRLGSIRDAGVEALGESSLSWAREMARNNPALKKQVDELTEAITDRFRKMGRDVHIVNGDILTGSRSEWRQIRTAMTDATEQAKQKTSEDFTEIQRKAVASLRSMGFGRGRARQLVQAMEDGGARGRTARQITNRSAAGIAGPVPGEGAVFGTGRKRARGGLIGGSGLMDTVPTPDGGMAAPGEAWIANRHTLGRLSQATVAMYGLTAPQVIAGESRPHWMPRRYALGGDAGRWSGLAGVNSGVADIATAVMNRFAGVQVTSTTGGRHARGSLHYSGAAVDLAGGNMGAAAAWLGQHFGARLAEGIHNPTLSIKNGRAVPPSFWGASTWANHANHIHLAVVNGGGARGAAGGYTGGGFGGVKLSGVGLRQDGVPGLLRQRAGDIYAAGLEEQLNSAVGGMGGGLAGFRGGGAPAENLRLGHRMMLAAGFGEDQWSALRELWTRESGWRAMARNPTSGAFGIPQALPPGKMGSAAVAGDAAAQINWGLGYIGSRYGSPAAALAFHNSHNWYARGGRLKWAGAFDRGGDFVTDGPTAFIAGEGPRNRRERVSIRPVGGSSGGGGGVTVRFEAGAVVVKVGGDGGGLDSAAAERIGEQVVAKIIEAIDRAATAGVID